jgi:hypothetical protein
MSYKCTVYMSVHTTYMDKEAVWRRGTLIAPDSPWESWSPSFGGNFNSSCAKLTRIPWREAEDPSRRGLSSLALYGSISHTSHSCVMSWQSQKKVPKSGVDPAKNRKKGKKETIVPDTMVKRRSWFFVFLFHASWMGVGSLWIGPVILESGVQITPKAHLYFCHFFVGRNTCNCESRDPLICIIWSN